MPVKRTRLTRQQQATYLACAQELQAAKIDCGIPEEWQENSSSLDIFVAPGEGNILCELSTGVTACAIYVELVSLRSNVVLENFAIASEWDSELIVLCGNQTGLYGFREAFEFTEEEVLNHRIENGLRFHHRGGVAEGWIVTTGRKPIPDKYRSWMTTKLSLTFTDQFGHDDSAQAEAILERSARLNDTAPHVRKSQGLFEVRPENEIGICETAKSALRPQGHAATPTYAWKGERSPAPVVGTTSH
jgi:hypothetical protein